MDNFPPKGTATSVALGSLVPALIMPAVFNFHEPYLVSVGMIFMLSVLFQAILYSVVAVYKKLRH